MPTTLATLSRGRIDRGGRTILRDLDVEVAAGSLTLVTGANGSGKSTLLAVLAGLRALDAGELRLPRGVRRAFVPQRSEVSDGLPLTVADVVGMGRWFGPRRGSRDKDRSIVDSCVHAVGMRGFEKRSLGELSGGQRQRAFLAQGLAQQADLLLLDEPTTGLDADGVTLMLRCIAAEQARGAAVVLVTHDRQAAVDATTRLRIDDGRLERAGRVHTSAP